MRDNLLNCTVFFLLHALPFTVAAQVSLEPIRQNKPVYQKTTLPSTVNPVYVVTPDADAGDKKSGEYYNISGQPNRFFPRQIPGAPLLEKQGGPISIDASDQSGNPAIKCLPGEKTTPPEPAMDKINQHQTFIIQKDDITYPDLQVTAIPESPQNQIFQGTERLPKTTLKKTISEVSGDRVQITDENKAITTGKMSFLKQYAAELKLQIEKNKNNANYPLAEKQEELSELENLLRGE